MGLAFFLMLLKKFGCEVYGSELKPKLPKSFKKKKIPLINNYENYNEKFDIISLWLVLEHLFDPALLFEQIHKLLKKNGKLIINIPNYKSLSARIFLKINVRCFQENSILIFFSIQNLEEFLSKNFFKTTLSETVISDIGTVKNFLNYSKIWIIQMKSLNLIFLEPIQFIKMDLDTQF